MKNIHVVSTPKPSRLWIWMDELRLGNLTEQSKSLKISNQNLFITNDEKLKEGDWFIRDGSIHKCFRVHKTDIEFLTSIDSVYCGSNTFWNKEFCKKIILTTDQDLIKDGVQAIDDKFLEWFVKNPSCEYVEVTPYHIIPSYLMSNEKPLIGYKITIPKDKLTKDEIDKFFVDMICNPKEPKQELERGITITYVGKQETLEEAARDAYNVSQERMYSEEEVLDIIENAFQSSLLTNKKISMWEWFEQFKKK